MAESKAPDLSLVYADGEGRPRVFAIPEGTTTLGRARDNDLVLEDPTVTSHHVVIFRDGEKLELRDLFSGETLVNEQKRRNGVLAAGDVLSLGQVRLRIMKVVPRRAPPAPIQSKPTDRFARPEPKTQRMLRPHAAAAELNATEGKKDRTTTAALPRPDLPTDLREPPPRTPTAAIPRQPAPAPAAAAAAPAPVVEKAGASDELREREARREKQLARARQLSDEMLTEDDFEVILEHIALGFLDVFAADRAVTVLFEEDGRNPLLTVERRRDGTDDGTGVAQEIVDRCLQVRSVIKIAGGHQGLGGLAAPLLSKGKAVGLLYFERMTASGQTLDSVDVHLMAILSNQAAVVIAPLVV